MDMRELMERIMDNEDGEELISPFFPLFFERVPKYYSLADNQVYMIFRRVSDAVLRRIEEGNYVPLDNDIIRNLEKEYRLYRLRNRGGTVIPPPNFDVIR